MDRFEWPHGFWSRTHQRGLGRKHGASRASVQEQRPNFGPSFLVPSCRKTSTHTWGTRHYGQEKRLGCEISGDSGGSRLPAIGSLHHNSALLYRSLPRSLFRSPTINLRYVDGIRDRVLAGRVHVAGLPPISAIHDAAQHCSGRVQDGGRKCGHECRGSLEPEARTDGRQSRPAEHQSELAGEDHSMFRKGAGCLGTLIRANTGSRVYLIAASGRRGVGRLQARGSDSNERMRGSCSTRCASTIRAFVTSA